jgi:hypothetical protein
MRRLLPLLLLLSGCVEPLPVDPPALPQQPSTGYVELTIDLDGTGLDPAAVTGVKIGGVSAFRLAPVDGTRLTVTTQGSPIPGIADAEIWTAEHDGGPAGAFSSASAALLQDVVEYTPPRHSAFDRVVALGASLTQGVQDAVPTQTSILQSPAVQIARQLGAYMPLPVFIDPLLPPMDPTILGPPPACTKPSVVGYVADQAVSVLGSLRDGDGDIVYWPARVDSLLTTHNVAVGGMRIAEVVNGVDPGNFGGAFLGHLVNEPFAQVGAPLLRTQIELIEALEPTLVISTDLYGNDLIIPIADAEGTETNLAELTDLPTFEAALAGFVEQMGPLGADVFVTTIPHPSALPAADLKAPEDIAVVDAQTDAFNERMLAAGEANDWLHVIDLAAEVEILAVDPPVIGGDVVSLTRFGGLLSIDSVHFSETGYGLVSNLFIDAINEVYGTDVPHVDLEALWEGDAARPANMRADGFDPDLCTGPEDP